MTIEDDHPPTALGWTSRPWIRAGCLLALLAVPAVAGTEEAPEAPEPAEPKRIAEAAYHFARGKLLADEGAFEEALDAYEIAVELDGSDPYSQVELARFHSYLAQISRSGGRQRRNLQAAARYAEEAHRLAPDNSDVLHAYAQIHRRLSEHQPESLELALAAYEDLRQRTEGDLQVLTSLGQIYMMQNRGAEAVEVLREALRMRPKHSMIQAMLVDALLVAERAEEAEQALVELLETDPDALEYRLQLAELLSERGDHRGATQVLSQAPAEAARRPRLRHLLAREMHLAGDNEQALALTDSLREELPDASGLGRLRVAILSSLARYDAAIKELEPLIADEQDPARSLPDTLLVSRLLERVGRSGEAVERLRDQLSRQSGHHRLQLELALAGVLERDQRPEEALALLDAALASVEPELAPLVGRSLVELLARLGRLDEALAAVDRIGGMIAADGDGEIVERLERRRLLLLASHEEWGRLVERLPPLLAGEDAETRLEAHLLYAQALAGLDRLDEALALLAGDRVDAGSARVVAMKAEILFDHGRGEEARALLGELAERGGTEEHFLVAQVYQREERYGEAVPLLDRVLEQRPESLTALFLRGAALERSGDHAAAESTFQQLLEQDPDYAPALNYLGYMWADLGENLADALEMIQRAVALEPDNGAYVDSLGWAYFRIGRYREARQHLEWAARLVPDDATIYEHLGDLYAALEDAERARASYRQALELGGGEDHEKLRDKLATLEEKGL